VLDVAERAAWPYRARHFAVRVTPALIAQEFRTELAGGRPPSVARDAVARGLITILAELQEARVTRLLYAVLHLDLPPNLKANLQALMRARSPGLTRAFSYEHIEGEEPRGVVFVASRGIAQDDKDEPGTALDGPLAAAPATESDELAATSDRPVTLI